MILKLKLQVNILISALGHYSGFISFTEKYQLSKPVGIPSVRSLSNILV